MNYERFHDIVKETLFYGSLPEFQYKALDMLIEIGLQEDRLLQETAYVLATSYHETSRYKYMSEIGEGEGHPYGQSVYLMSGKTVKYYGRGFVQLTWLGNYLNMERKLGVTLVDQPEKLTEYDLASKVIWSGMTDGDFTGHCLEDYITEEKVDYVGARFIVNGNDSAQHIAECAKLFESALLQSGYDGNEPVQEVCPSCGQNLPLTS